MKVCHEDRKCSALLLPWEQVGMHLKAVLPQTSNHRRARWVLHPELWAQASGISPKSLSPVHLKSDMASPSWPSWIIASPKFSMKGVQSAYLVSSEHLPPSLTPPPPWKLAGNPVLNSSHVVKGYFPPHFYRTHFHRLLMPCCQWGFKEWLGPLIRWSHPFHPTPVISDYSNLSRVLEAWPWTNVFLMRTRSKVTALHPTALSSSVTSS